MRTTVAILLAAIALAAPPAASQGPQAMERDSWTGPISPGSTIRIDNPHGDIRLRHGGAEPNLEAAAVFQQLSIDGAKLVLDVAVDDDAVTVSILRLDTAGQPATAIPRGVQVRAETGSGLLEARGVRSDVDLASGSGTIRAAENRGRIDARTERGVVEVTLIAHATRQPQQLTSVTGSITVFTPADNDLDVSMATSGTITTDFTLEITHDDLAEPNKTATARVGDGGPDLIMTSKRGDLALRRIVAVEQD